jgi:hypothetical protein
VSICVYPRFLFNYAKSSNQNVKIQGTVFTGRRYFALSDFGYARSEILIFALSFCIFIFDFFHTAATDNQ